MPVGSLDHNAIFIDFVLEQPVPQLVYLKSSVSWELVRRGVKGLKWNGIIRPPFSLSSLSEALLRVIRNRVPKRTIVVGMGDKPWFDNWCVLVHRAKQRIYRVLNRSRTQADWEEHRVARRQAQLIYDGAERAFTERSKSLLTNATNPPKWWSSR